MGEIIQKIIPVKLQLDTSESYRDAFNAQFCANARGDLNINSDSASVGNTIFQGGNVRKITPIQSLEIVCPDIVLPTGTNICIGAFESPTTNEVYFNVWNSLDNYSIWRLNTEEEICEKVYEGECLNFKFPPQYHIPAHRSALYIVYDSDGEGNRVIRNKFYVFTDGYNWQFFIDVESSIATDSYDPVAFPYFTTFYPYCDPCEFVQLGIRPPDCPKVLSFDDDTPLQVYEPEPENNNLKEVWYFATSFIDRWGRHSVLSPYSTATFLDGGDCNADAEDIKCFRLILDAGSWLVEKIVVYFSNDGINWFKYDEIEKYEECPPEDDFWDRSLALNNYYNPIEDCSGIGCFETVIYNWDFRAVPPEYFQREMSIVIDGTTHTHAGFEEDGSPPFGDESPPDEESPPSESPPDESPPEGSPPDGSPPIDEDLEELLVWLNSLGLGTFWFVDEILKVSSVSIVYGDFTFDTSPPVVLEVYTGEGSPPEDGHLRDGGDTDVCGDANTFIYQFCANKQCIPIDAAEVARIFDDLPIASVGQAILDDKLVYADNLREYDNFICPIENISIDMLQAHSPCEAELVTVIIDAVIHNPYKFINNIIYSPSGSTDVAFGGLGEPLNFPSVVEYEDEVISSYNQKIANPYRGSTENGNQGSPGFIGGMRGTNFRAISQQYYINDLTKTFFFDNVDHNHSTKSIMKGIREGNYVIQRWTFKIPKGYYIFEVYSHLATSFDDCVGTSTYFLGVIDKTLYLPLNNNIANTDLNTRELIINACDGDVEYPDYIMISDLTNPKATISVASDARSAAGYLKEKDTNVPIELAELHPDSTITRQSFGTDANGFYFITDTANYEYNLFVLNPDNCDPIQVKTDNIEINSTSLSEIDVIIDNPTLVNFNECGHELVSGTVLDCDGNPISGIAVVLSRTGTFSITDDDGNYEILAHDDANWASQNAGQRRKEHNIDFVMISQAGVCIYSECDQCETCIDTQHVWFTNSCFQCPVATNHYNFVLRILSGALTGVKTGGTYAISIIGYDYLDRNNSAQRIGFFTVPTIQSNGVFAPYSFHWAFTGAMNFPSWVKKVRFAVRPNSNEFLLSWIANKVEFLDASGNITSPTIAANIKIYIDGLNTFNTNNFLNTNTAYQWVAGDRIRFIANGDGTLFDTITNNGLIDLPASSLVNGNALLIPFDSRLAGLEANAIFELYRVPVCEIEAVYLEQCPTIPVIDGEPVDTSGTIPFFDTYWFFREIPQTNQEGNEFIFISPHRYEHHSPSDFWGDHLIATGRPFVRNENQRQTWYLDEFGWSDSLLEGGVINGLGTWRTINRKSYLLQGAGGIVAIKAQDGLIHAICENNWMVINISQNLLLITSGGNVQANPDYFGNKQQKIGNIYGCDFRDTSTIIYHNEWIMWADTNRSAWCLSNYQTVWDVTKEIEGVSTGGMKGYWIDKFNQIALVRDENEYIDDFMFLHAGYDPKTNEVNITSFTKILLPTKTEYVNEEIDWDTSMNETVSYNLAGFWAGSYGFTPERFIGYQSGKNGSQLLSFRQGSAWIHHRIKTSGITFNNFYNIQCKSIIKFVMNGGEQNNLIQKKFLALRVECKDLLLYADQIFTQGGQQSQIPIEDFEFVELFSEAAFLCDVNTVNPNGISAVQDGDSLYGGWIKIRLIVDPERQSEYFEILGIIVSATKSS